MRRNDLLAASFLLLVLLLASSCQKPAPLGPKGGDDTPVVVADTSTLPDLTKSADKPPREQFVYSTRFSHNPANANEPVFNPSANAHARVQSVYICGRRQNTDRYFPRQVLGNIPQGKLSITAGDGTDTITLTAAGPTVRISLPKPGQAVADRIATNVVLRYFSGDITFRPDPTEDADVRLVAHYCADGCDGAYFAAHPDEDPCVSSRPTVMMK